MAMKNDAKFEEKLTWGISQILARALESLKIFSLMSSFWAKSILFELKSTEELSFITLQSDAKFLEELTSHFEIDMKNLVNFDPSTPKSQTFAH